MHAHNTINKLKHQILFFTLGGIILTASIAGISVVFPFYSFVTAENEDNLIIEASNRAMLVDTYLNGLRGIAAQVASRTFARKQLEKYLQGKIDQTTLAELSLPILDDSMKRLPELVAVIRHDNNGNALFHVGQPLPEIKWKIPPSRSRLPIINGPIKLNGKNFLYITAPIFDKNRELLATDVLVFNLIKLHEILHSPSDFSGNHRVELGWVQDTLPVLFFESHHHKNTIKADSPLAQAIRLAVKGEKNLLTGDLDKNDDYMTAYSPVNNADWGVTVSLPAAELYDSANRQILFTGGLMILLTIIGTFITFVLIRPLSGKILLESDDLKKEIHTKTIELKQANKSLQALNEANEALLKTSVESELLNKICQIIVDVADFNFAWIGLIDDKNPQQVLSATQYGCENTGLNVEKLLQDNQAWSKSPAGLAIQKGKPAVFNGSDNAEVFGGHWQKTNSCCCTSVAGFPLIVNNSTLGVLLIFSTAAGAFDKEQVKLMQQLTDNLAFGLMVLHDKADRQKLQRQLLQSQKMEAIGLLTGGIAHDFNNILASILGYTELLQNIHQKGKNAHKAPGYLDCIEKSGQRARDLVSQMLAFSRGGSSEPRPLVLAKTIKESLKMLQSTIPSSIELYAPIDDKTTTVMMDSVQLHQLMLNLCINARDAMQGSGKISITLRRIKFENKECSSCHTNLYGEYEELQVKDTGSGIEAGTLQKIFDPFFTTKEFGKGSGMGLSMVHGIMHEHGGHIMVNSSPETGTSFHLLFPLLDATAQPETEQVVVVNADADADNTQVITDSNKHILVVDDDVMVADFEKEMLLNRGYQVTVKTDSLAALELVKNNPQQFDLVLTDQTMPGITGIEMAQEIRRFAPNMPIILCTGYSEHVDEHHAKEMGIHAFLNKPVNTRKLLQAMNHIAS